ncbi:MAG: YraN family protein [Clostridiales bacterium]|nr:YraN family protein [Clostridiales bacterium]
MAGVSSGAAGEVIAARFLREKGYTIEAANFRSRFGEIDIIASDTQYIAFVEVKTRSEDSRYTPREAVTEGKQARVLRTAALYLQQHPTSLQPRFDVVEVVTGKGKPLEAQEIDHLMGAYEAGDLSLSF